MTLLPPQRPATDLPVAHGGCTCSCHTTPGVTHVTPCCFEGVSEDDDSDRAMFLRQDLATERDAVVLSAAAHSTPTPSAQQPTPRVLRCPICGTPIHEWCGCGYGPEHGYELAP
jgi:hypothetical protein